MNILFNTSVTGRDEYEKNYREIDRVLNELGHEVISPVFIAWKEDVENPVERDADILVDAPRSRRLHGGPV